MHADEVRALDALHDWMRARGVVRADVNLGELGRTVLELGPPPPPLVQLEKAAADATEPAVKERLNKELAEELRRERVERARADMRLQLAATGIEYTDKQLDAFIGEIE